MTEDELLEPHHGVPHHSVTDSDRPAGIVSRGIGAFVDLLAVSVILSGAYLGVVMARLLFSLRDFTFPHANIVFSITGFIVVSIAYLALCWAISGRTLGSVLMGLRVVNRRGGRLRPGIALVRALLCTFFAIGLAWAAVDARRRSVADIILRTRVVYSR